MTRIIAVVGATGQQGGAVVNALLSLKSKSNDEIVIRGITTNTSSDNAKKLKSKGIEVVEGNFNDPSSLIKAFNKCWGLFIVTTVPTKGSIEKETQDGINCIDAAIKNGISYVVFSSVASADKNTKIPHFETKYQIEKYLIEKADNFKNGYFILRPVFFMDNFSTILPPKNGIVSLPLKENTDIQMIAVEDIGRLAARSLIWHQDYAYKKIDIASDSLNGKEVANVLSQVSGKSIKYNTSSWFVKLMLRIFANDYKIMFEWIDNVGYTADIAETKKNIPEAYDFKTWANLHFKNADIGPKKPSTGKIIFGTILVTTIGVGGYYYYRNYIRKV